MLLSWASNGTRRLIQSRRKPSPRGEVRADPTPPRPANSPPSGPCGSGRPRSSLVQRLAQAADVHVDRAGLDIDVRAPDRVEQLLAAEHPAGVLHQIVEQAELGRAQVHLLAAAAHPVGDPVDDDVAVADAVLGQARAGCGAAPRGCGRPARSSRTA